MSAKAKLKDVIRWAVEQGLKESGGKLRAPFIGEMKKLESGRLEVTITTDSRDRHGDIMVPGGAVLTAYKRNPVVMFGHDYTQPPIARAYNLRKDKNRITAELQWAPTAFAREVGQLYEAGFMHAWSIGFIPLEWDEIMEKGEGGEDDQIAGYRVKKWELLEFSAVPIPANPEALTNCAEIVTQKGLRKALGLDKAVPLETEPKAARPEGSWKYCVCPKCDYYEDHEAGKPCGKCPKCGAKLEGSDDKPKAVEPEVEQKPGWDEDNTYYRYRVRDPKLFDPDSFRTVTVKKDKPRVMSVMGKLKGEDTMTIQNVMFPKGDDWTMAKAKAWLKAHPNVLKAWLGRLMLEMEMLEAQLETAQGDFAELKEGRVLSGKNRTLLGDTSTKLMDAVNAIDELLEATEPQKAVDDKKLTPKPETEPDAQREHGSQDGDGNAQPIAQLSKADNVVLAGRVGDALRGVLADKISAAIKAELDRRQGRVE